MNVIDIIKEEIFLNENPNQAIKYLKGKNLDPATNPKGKLILNTITGFTKGDGYTYLLTLFNVNEKMPMDDLRKLYEYLKTNKEFTNRLPKPVVTYASYRELRNDLDAMESMKVMKKLYNQLPATLKQQQGELSVQEKQKLKELAEKFNILTPDQQNFFIKKVSGYKDIKTFIGNLKNYIYAIENNEDFNSILAKIENTPNAAVAYADPDKNIIIAHIKSFDASKALGCTSNWCITRDTEHWRNYKKGGNKYFFIWDFNYPAEDINYMVGTAYNPNNPETSQTHLKDDKQTQLSAVVVKKGLSFDIFTDYLKKYNQEIAASMEGKEGLSNALSLYESEPDKLVDIIASSEFIREFSSPPDVEHSGDYVYLGMDGEKMRAALDLGEEYDYIERTAHDYGYNDNSYDSDEVNYMHNGLNSDNIELLVDLAKKLGVPANVYEEFDSEEGAIYKFLEKYDLEDISSDYLSEYSNAKSDAESREAKSMIDKVPFIITDGSFRVSNMIDYIKENNITANNFDELIEAIKENMPDFSYEAINDAGYQDIDLDGLNSTIKRNIESIIDKVENDPDNEYYVKAKLIVAVNDSLEKLGFTLTQKEDDMGEIILPDKKIVINSADYDNEEDQNIYVTASFMYNHDFFKKHKQLAPKHKKVRIPLEKLKNYISQYELDMNENIKMIKRIISEEMTRYIIKEEISRFQ